MAKFEIACPYHGKLETVEVPDDYRKSGFEGHVRCGDTEDHRPIKIRISRGNVIKVEMA